MNQSLLEKKVPYLFLGAALLAYPLVWIAAGHFSLAVLFNHAALALWALLLIFLVPGRAELFFLTRCRVNRVVMMLLMATAVTILLGYYRHRGNCEVLLNGMYYLTLPLLAAVYSREFRKVLPGFVVLLGIADVALLMLLSARNLPPHGLAGNWNWSATLLTLAGAAAGTLFARHFDQIPLRKDQDLVWGGAALAILVMAFDDAYLPRGTMFGFVLAAGIMLLLRRGLAAGHRRYIIAAGLVGVGFLLLPAAMALRMHGPWLEEGPRSDLALATFSLLKEQGLLGAGPGLFESAIAPFVPESYYLGAFAAERNLHPHNELLFYFSTFGIGGLTLAAAFFFAVFKAGCRRFAAVGEKEAERSVEFSLLAVLFLAFHGQFDSLLDNWPCDTIFLLAIGTLWGYAAEVPDAGAAAAVPKMTEAEEVTDHKVTEVGPSKSRRPLLAVQIALLLALILLLATNFGSGWLLRRAVLAAEAGDKAAYGELLERSCRVKWTPDNLYRGAMVELFDRKNPVAALDLLMRIEPKTGFANYRHNQGLTARALVAAGKPGEALPFFELEQTNFPLGAGNLYFYEQVLRHLDEADAADAVEARLRRSLELRKLTRSDIPILLQKPEWDVNPNLIKAKK
jgi:hypothetical protein